MILTYFHFICILSFSWLTSLDTADITSKPALSKNFIGQTSCQCEFLEFEEVPFCPKYDLENCQSCKINASNFLSCEIESILPSPPMCVLPIKCSSTLSPGSTTTSK